MLTELENKGPVTCPVESPVVQYEDHWDENDLEAAVAESPAEFAQSPVDAVIKYVSPFSHVGADALRKWLRVVHNRVVLPIEPDVESGEYLLTAEIWSSEEDSHFVVSSIAFCDSLFADG